MKTIELVYFNAGGGHRAAAQALQAVIALPHRPWQVRLVNLFEVLDPQERFRKLTGLAPEDYYNARLARGWTMGLGQELKLLQGLIKLTHQSMVQRLHQHWQASRPDLVVSLIPNFNRALREGLAGALPGVPFVVVMTDLADLPPHFWIEPGLDQHLVCGTRRAVDQARSAGLAEDRIHAVSGMLLRPGFYAPPATDRAAQRRALGLADDRPCGVVMFGGQGSLTMLEIARCLPDTPLILMCGHNRALAARLRRMPSSAPRVVLGHTDDVAGTMRLGDFFIGKPGPGSISEALCMGLPVIVLRNAWTMPQERYNPDWVLEQGMGAVIRSVGDVTGAVADLLPRLPALKSRVAAMDNRAVFEVTDLLERLLGAAPPAPPRIRLAAVTPA